MAVESNDEGESDAARALAMELAAACATDATWADVERLQERAGRVEWVCAELVAGRVVLGKRLSVGRHTPAVQSAHAWAVLGKHGEPIALAHDSFEAARIFVDAEERGPSDLEDDCCAMDTDTERERRYLADRLDEYEWRMASYNASLARGRARGAA